MKKLPLLCALSVLCIPTASIAKSIARPGEPRITFVDVDLSMKSPIEMGTTFRLTATVIPTQNIWEEEKVFMHLVRADDPEKVIINADFTPPYQTTRWAVGEAVKLGPVNLKASEGISPGKYKIRLGLFHRGDDGVYVREKYTNPEIKDWIVGEVEFASVPRAASKLPDLVISDFSSEADLVKWQARSVQINRRGKMGVIEYIQDDAEIIPSAIIQDFFSYADPRYSDWRGYDKLAYDIGLDPDYRVTLQVKDKAGNRFQTDAVEEGEGGRVEVNLVSVGKVLDLGDIGNLSFFTYKPKENFNMTLGDIRLIDTGAVAFERTFVEFRGLSAPQKARAGGTISLTAHFLLHQKFPRDETIFIHFSSEGADGGYFIADTAPLIETTDWPVGKIIKEGPLKIYIPIETPPGMYNIELGFFSTQRTGDDPSYVKTYVDSFGVVIQDQPTKDGIDYIRQPNTNPPKAGPWTVGEIEILPAAE